MNRKILLTVLALVAVLLATPYIGMAHADGKGTTKQSFEFYLVGFTVPGPDFKIWEPDTDIVQIRGLAVVVQSMVVTVGGTPYTPVSYSGSIDLMLKATGDGTIRVQETIVFADGGTLEIQTAEKGIGTGGEGSFVGHGTGSLEGVKVEGTTSTPDDIHITRVGTVMGWP